MTHLTSISIRNFKAYKGLQEIPLKPLTLIFGPNSSGKSSIIHALAFLKHVALNNGHCSPDEVDLIWDKVTLGGWQNLLHGHDLSHSLSLGLGLGGTKVQWSFSTVKSTPSVMDCVVEENGKSVLTATINEPGKLVWKVTLGNQHPVMLDLHHPADEPGSGIKRYRPVPDEEALPLGLRGNAWLFLTDSFSKKQTLQNGESVFGWEQFNAAFIEYLQIPQSNDATGVFPSMISEQAHKNKNDPEYHGYDLMWFGGDVLKKKLLNALKEDLDYHPILIEFFEHCVSTASSSGEFPDSDGVRAFADLFQSYVHIGPSREAPPRDIDSQSLENNAMYGPWLELRDKFELRKQVNQSLERLGLNYELVTRWKESITYYPNSGESSPKFDSKNVEFSDAQKQLAFQIKGARVTLSHRDLGYGVSMVLPILVALNNAKFDLITMEQPELHLHPLQQAVLGDELITAALRAEKSKQLIIETHSEHLILRILRRIAESTEKDFSDWSVELIKACPDGIQPKDVAVLYVEPSQKGAIVKELRINHLGEFIDEWPRGFFEERIREMF
jgi:hypothetical protein